MNTENDSDAGKDLASPRDGWGGFVACIYAVVIVLVILAAISWFWDPLLDLQGIFGAYGSKSVTLTI
jgi:hypothetical protein